MSGAIPGLFLEYSERDFNGLVMQPNLMLSNLSDTFKRAIESFNAGRLDKAEQLCKLILSARPGHLDTLHLLAVVQSVLGRSSEALASYDKVLAIKPDFAPALSNRGNLLQNLNRFDEALASYDKALAIKADFPEAWNNRGNALQALKRFDEALVSYDKALAIAPRYPDALYNRGNSLQQLERFEDAVASYDEALALKPDYINAWHNRGNAQRNLLLFRQAVASYDRVLALKADHFDAVLNRGNALQQLKHYEQALASYEKCLAINPSHAEAWYNRANTLRDLRRFEQASTSYDTALTIKPDHRYALSGLAESALKICNWERTERLACELETHIAEARSIITPFTLLGYTGNESLLLKCARNYAQDKAPALPSPVWTGEQYIHDKIRIAYLSADFRRHATAFLIAGLFERHDRARFQVHGVSFSVDDKSEVRSRLIKSFDKFHDVTAKSDRDVAKLLHELEVDIAIDLKGYTQDARPDIFAHRGAPVQVSYLGYPGTIGAEFIDYVIADKTVLPFEQQPFYTEKIVHLPACYQINDSTKEISARTPTRQEAGLPDGAFVFCCFNNNYKIRPPVFDCWMRLLAAVKGSVLWLLTDDATAETNLRKEALARGIDPARIVFAGRLPLEDHLARHRLADLFLDTLPYNAHTTASDALWAGVPLLTCRGTGFAGRVGASLLYATGLPELVTTSLVEYEAQALRLAADASLLREIRERIKLNRLKFPLFDTNRTRRHIEAAYTKMWEIWQSGEPARSFSLEAVL